VLKRIALIALLFIPASSFAIPVQWTLDGFLIQGFQPAGTAGGSFIYDADNGMFSDIALFTTGTSTGGLTFTALAGESPFYGLNFLQPGANGVDRTIAFQLNGIFLSSLTNAGGVLIVNPSPGTAYFAEFACGGGDDCGLGSGGAVSNWYAWRETPSTLTGRILTSVDEPGTLGLLGAAAVLGLITRRRRAVTEKSGG
jgi:hypothetical protein